jgi:hypothetical protein
MGDNMHNTEHNIGCAHRVETKTTYAASGLVGVHERCSLTNIPAAPIPLPTHMLVHRNSPFRLRSSSRPVTTWRTPATMSSISSYPRSGGRQRTHAQRVSQGNGATAKHNTINTTCQQKENS